MAVKAAPVGVLEDGTVFYAPLGEVLHDRDDLVCCHLCGRWLRKVGATHLRVGHGWTLAEYREAFRLLQSIPTCSRHLSAGMRRHAQARLGQKGFGTPPSDAGGGIRPVPGWRSLGRVRPDLAAELHESRNGELDAGGVAAASHRKAWCAVRVAGTSGRRRSRTVSCAGLAARGVRAGARCRNRALSSGSARSRSSVLISRPSCTPNAILVLTLTRSRRVWDAVCGGGVGAAGTSGRRWYPIAPPGRVSCVLAVPPRCGAERRRAGALAESQGAVARDRSCPTRNPGLDPDTLGSRSSRRVWWACSSCGHEWQALVSSRSVGDGCPSCARRRQRERGPRPVSIERSLAVRRPELVAELHPTRNRGIDPTALGAGSGWKAWSRCGVCGHDWAATVGNRTNGSGCPRCAREPNSVS